MQQLESFAHLSATQRQQHQRQQHQQKQQQHQQQQQQRESYAPGKNWKWNNLISSCRSREQKAAHSLNSESDQQLATRTSNQQPAQLEEVEVEVEVEKDADADVAASTTQNFREYFEEGKSVRVWVEEWVHFFEKIKLKTTSEARRVNSPKYETSLHINRYTLHNGFASEKDFHNARNNFLQGQHRPKLPGFIHALPVRGTHQHDFRSNRLGRRRWSRWVSLNALEEQP